MTNSTRPSILKNGPVKTGGAVGGGVSILGIIAYLLLQSAAHDTKNATQDVKIERTQEDVREMKADLKKILRIVSNQSRYPRPVRNPDP